MELQYETKSVPYMRRVLQKSSSKEITQEFRLPDGYGDIGRILATWGQVILRGKNWTSNEIELTGGVMMWVLYMPEGTDQPQCIETWIPFQMEFDIPKTDIDGVINASCHLCMADSRTVSTRKMILRANVGITMDALVADKLEIHCFDELPDSVQILRNTYPAQIPIEAGEKAFAIDEEVEFPASSPVIEKIIRYDVRIEMIENKIMTDKIVFRGVAVLHITYISDDNRIYNWDAEIPFSQYAQLENDFETAASAQIMSAVTGLELERTPEGKIHIKTGILCQYTVHDIKMLELSQDAYSLTNETDVAMQSFTIPVMLDSQNESVTIGLQSNINAASVADVSCCNDLPACSREGDMAVIQPVCHFQILYYDDENALQCLTGKGEGSWQFSVESNAEIFCNLSPSGNPQLRVDRSGVTIQRDILIQSAICIEEEMQTISQIELQGEKCNLCERPSLVLRPAGQNSLWELSKKYGSTVEGIRSVNQLLDESDKNKMLIIPIA